ncbi:MAG: pyridoxamine 5'-phosphate oxidase family protein [Desulfovibrionaceae bacterium]|nr:pyridoxamine 5'-phosphate oxidase family protein [Desulfovibrionaceae bacterium]
MLNKIRTMAREADVCVLATCRDGAAHCSLMAYVAGEDDRFYMVASAGSKKYQNLEANPRASLLIDDRDRQPKSGRGDISALTVSAFRRDMSGDEEKVALARLLERHPRIRALASRPEARIVCLKASGYLLAQGVDKATYVDPAGEEAKKP